MSIDRDSILAHFRIRQGDGQPQMWSDMSYVLMRVILGKVDFENLEQLADFCGDPNSLLPWVAGESDRAILSSQLAEGVREMIAGTGSAACPAG